MIRAAAKNHAYVTVIVEPADYAPVLAEIKADGMTTCELRQRLAAKAYARTAAYDAVISGWFADTLHDEARLPAPRRQIGAAAALRRKSAPEGGVLQDRATAPGSRRRARCRARDCPTTTSTIPTRPSNASPSSIPTARPLRHHQARQPVRRCRGRSCSAYRQALACDPTSAPLAASSRSTADRRRNGRESRHEIFTEVIVAPDASDEAIKIVAAKKNLRLLLTGGLPDPRAGGLTVRSVAGGLLVQSRDNAVGRRDAA